MSLFSPASPRIRSSRWIPGGRQQQRRQRLLSVVICLFLGLVAIVLHNEATRLPGCATAQIWSHRAHLDASSELQWECEDVMRELSLNGISHFDVDVINHGGLAIVAHPVEMSDNQQEGFSRSPCSKLSLVQFLELLKKYYGAIPPPSVSVRGGKSDVNFYITIEPKSAWTEAAPFLAPPQQVLGGILDVLDSELGKMISGRCGIILDPWQAKDSRVFSLRKRLEEHCDLSIPIRLRQAPLIHGEVEELSKLYKIVMPTLELFGGSAGRLYLQATAKFKMQVEIWVIDTVEDLRKALKLGRINGIVSNQPVKMQKAFKEICW